MVAEFWASVARRAAIVRWRVVVVEDCVGLSLWRCCRISWRVVEWWRGCCGPSPKGGIRESEGCSVGACGVARASSGDCDEVASCQDHALAEEARVEVGADALVDVLAHHEVLRDQRHLAAASGQEVRGRRRRVVAVLVDDDDAPARRHAAQQHVDRGGDVRQVHAGEVRHAGGRARRHDHGVRLERQDVGHSRADAEAHVDAGLPDLAREPLGDHRVVLALRRLRGGEDLAAERRARLEEGHPVPPDRGHSRGFQPGRAAADHDDALRALGRADHAELRLAADQRVLDAADRLALAEPADAALAGADADPDVVEPALDASSAAARGRR